MGNQQKPFQIPCLTVVEPSLHLRQKKEQLDYYRSKLFNYIPWLGDQLLLTDRTFYCSCIAGPSTNFLTSEYNGVSSNRDTLLVFSMVCNHQAAETNPDSIVTTDPLMTGTLICFNCYAIQVFFFKGGRMNTCFFASPKFFVLFPHGGPVPVSWNLNILSFSVR